jgi:hypothetical protein
MNISYYNQLNINPDEAVDKVGGVVDNAKQKADEITNDASKKVGKAVDELGKVTINILLSAFDNLLPKLTTGLTRPIIASVIFHFLCLLLLFIINEENKKFVYIPIFILLLVSFFLNTGFFLITFSLFSLIFNAIGDISGIGDNRTGSAIYLAGLSSAFLLIALILFLKINLK